MMRRSSPLLLALALGTLGTFAVACGSNPTPPREPPTPPSPDLSAVDAAAAMPVDAGSTATADTPTPDPTPPPPPPGSTKITLKHDPAWASCHATYKPKSKDMAAEALKSAKSCATVTKMKSVTTQKGTQGDTNAPQQVKLDGKAGKCYRVYAMADDGIKDLDLLLKDSTGAVAGEDSTDDPSPVLVEDGAFCFKEADSSVVVVSVGQGKGNWALQIWSD